MIRKNPRGDIPQVHERAFLCGMIIVHKNVFIGPYAVIRANEVNGQGEMEPIIVTKGFKTNYE